MKSFISKGNLFESGMSLNYSYPTYKIDLTNEILEQCVNIAGRLLEEVGTVVRHGRFLDSIRGKDGVKVSGERVYLDKKLFKKIIEKFIAENSREFLNEKEKLVNTEWKMTSNGWSMCVIDIETEEIRDATCQDLKDMIRLKDSYGIYGYYPVMPQDLPPIMSTIACFKICWESSDKTKPFDYQNPEQTRYIYEMAKVVGKTFEIVLNVPYAMRISEQDIDIFLSFYPY